MKKFKEFIKEYLEVQDIIPEEEIEDQFLRIKEVLNHEYVVFLNRRGNIRRDSIGYTVVIHDNKEDQIEKNGAKRYPPEIYKEIEDIKRRMEHMYPRIKISVKMPLPSFYLGVSIEL